MTTIRALLAPITFSLISFTAHADIIPINVAISGTTGQLAYVDLNGSATGTYNSETGSLQFSGGWSNATVAITADWVIDGLSGTKTYSSCEQQVSSLVSLCSGLPGSPAPFPIGDPLSMDVTLNDVNNSGNGQVREWIEGGGDFSTPGYTLFYEVTAVPVPAAAWLFGSALVGVFGLRRGYAG